MVSEDIVLRIGKIIYLLDNLFIVNIYLVILRGVYGIEGGEGYYKSNKERGCRRGRREIFK